MLHCIHHDNNVYSSRSVHKIEYNNYRDNNDILLDENKSKPSTQFISSDADVVTASLTCVLLT